MECAALAISFLRLESHSLDLAGEQMAVAIHHQPASYTCRTDEI